MEKETLSREKETTFDLERKKKNIVKKEEKKLKANSASVKKKLER